MRQKFRCHLSSCSMGGWAQATHMVYLRAMCRISSIPIACVCASWDVVTTAHLLHLLRECRREDRGAGGRRRCRSRHRGRSPDGGQTHNALRRGHCEPQSRSISTCAAARQCSSPVMCIDAPAWAKRRTGRVAFMQRRVCMAVCISTAVCVVSEEALGAAGKCGASQTTVNGNGAEEALSWAHRGAGFLQAAEAALRVCWPSLEHSVVSFNVHTYEAGQTQADSFRTWAGGARVVY
jgi:hypothetical protein